MAEKEYCQCKESKSVYPDEVNEWGYGYFCSDCNKEVEGEGRYYDEPEFDYFDR